MKKRIFLFCCLALITGYNAFAQLVSEIKTVRLHPEKNEQGLAVIELNSDQKLLLSFDELGLEARYFRYDFIHCDADWNPSPIRQNQYLDRFFAPEIQDIQFSMNTIQPYTHYRLLFPNEQTTFLESGNYLIRVYDENSPDMILIEEPFSIVKSMLSVEGKVMQPKRSDYRLSRQELEFSLNSTELNIINPFQNLKVAVRQNGRTDNMTFPKPKYINGNQFSFQDDEALVFDGGNEFRNFDIKNLEYNSEYLKRIYVQNDSIFVDVHPAINRATSTYMNTNDINGNYIIWTDHRSNKSTESEYVLVNLTLPSLLLKNGDVHIHGRFTHWNLSPMSKMEYDLEKQAYTKSLYLKQGFYDYQYLFLPQGSSIGETKIFENNFWETKNDYHIFVYYRFPGNNFDSCIGFYTIRSE